MASGTNAAQTNSQEDVDNDELLPAGEDVITLDVDLKDTLFDMINPEYYQRPKDSINCVVGLMPSPNVPKDTIVLGSAFLRKYYMIFDLRQSLQPPSSGSSS